MDYNTFRRGLEEEFQKYLSEASALLRIVSTLGATATLSDIRNIDTARYTTTILYLRMVLGIMHGEKFRAKLEDEGSRDHVLLEALRDGIKCDVLDSLPDVTLSNGIVSLRSLIRHCNYLPDKPNRKHSSGNRISFSSMLFADNWRS